MSKAKECKMKHVTINDGFFDITIPGQPKDAEPYMIPINKCDNYEKYEDWERQLGNKTWATDEIKREFRQVVFEYINRLNNL